MPIAFQWLRTPEPERIFSLSERPEWLRLFGRESVGSFFEQALVARRQDEHDCSAEVELDFNPQHFQHQAGLIAYYNKNQFHYAYLTRDDEGIIKLAIQSCLGDPADRLTFPVGEGVALTDGHLRLGMDISGSVLQFRFAPLGSGWQTIGPELDATVLSDEGGRGEHQNFTGNFVGMAAQDISGHGHPADFRAFTYRTGV